MQLDEIRYMLAAWALQAVVAAGAITPLVLSSRHRVPWRAWQLLALLLPFCIWVGGHYIWPAVSLRKGLGNFVAEPCFIGLAVGAAAFIRVFVGKAREEAILLRPAFLFAAVCLVAALVFLFTPGFGGGY